MVLYKWEVSPSSGLDQIECQFAVCEACQRVTSQFGAIRGVSTMWRLRQLTACPEQHEPSRSPLRLLRNMSLPSPGWSCKLTSFLSFAPPVCFVLASCRASARFPLHVSSQVEQLAISGDRTDEIGQRSTTAAGRDSRDMTHKADAANAKRRTMNSSCIWWPLPQACSATAARSCTGRQELQGSRQDSGPSDHGEVNQGRAIGCEGAWASPAVLWRSSSRTRPLSAVMARPCQTCRHAAHATRFLSRSGEMMEHASKQLIEPCSRQEGHEEVLLQVGFLWRRCCIH